jgi:hypothetical protein
MLFFTDSTVDGLLSGIEIAMMMMIGVCCCLLLFVPVPGTVPGTSTS